MADLALTLWAIPGLHEENPVCLWLLTNGSWKLLAATKAASSLIVVAVLGVLYRFRRTWAWPTAVSLSLFQAGLLYYCVT